MNQKKTFAIVIVLFVILLAVLPFLVTFNEFLTHLVEKLKLYMWIQEKIIPFEVRMVGVLVKPFGVDFIAYREGLSANGIFTKVTWNCIGWQSLLLFLATLPFGLKGNYSLNSKLETILIGLTGTFLVNLLRMVFIVLLLAWSRPLFAVVYHDYLAAVVTILWLLVFWWFVYAYVLEEKPL